VERGFGLLQPVYFILKPPGCFDAGAPSQESLRTFDESASSEV
jgi:hypothetical protein